MQFIHLKNVWSMRYLTREESLRFENLMTPSLSSLTSVPVSPAAPAAVLAWFRSETVTVRLACIHFSAVDSPAPRLSLTRRLRDLYFFGTRFNFSLLWVTKPVKYACMSWLCAKRKILLNAFFFFSSGSDQKLGCALYTRAPYTRDYTVRLKHD